MLRKLSSHHGVIGFGLILVVGIGSLGYSWWLAGRVFGGTSQAPAVVDLSQLRWYARQGFSDRDRSGFDPAAPGVRAVDHLPLILNQLFAIPPGAEVNEFATMTSFSLLPETTSQALALNLSNVGDNWAVYLNGLEVRRDIFPEIDGQIAVHRTRQQGLIILPPGALKPGVNTLVIRFIGAAPAVSVLPGWTPGLGNSQGYVIGPAGGLLRDRAIQDAVSWFEVGVYFFVALNYLLLFVRQRESYSFYFSLFLLNCAAYSFASSNLAYEVIPNADIIGRVMYVCNTCSPALLGLTLWPYLYPARPAPTSLRLLLGLTVVASLVLWLVPNAWVDPAFSVSLVGIVASVIYIIALAVQALRRGIRDAAPLLATAPVICLLVAWEVLDFFVFRTGIDLTGWIPFSLAVAFALIFVDRFWRLQTALLESNRQLSLSRDHLEEQVEARSAELRAANTELGAANRQLTETGAQVQGALEEVRRLNADLERRVEERTGELRLAKDAAESANRAKTAFLAIMGHELRTPLNGIFLAAEMLRDHIPEAASYRDLPEIILTSGRRLLKMLEGVLEFATADSGRASAETNAEAALHDLARGFEPRAAQHGLQLTFNVGVGLPAIRFDPQQFDHVMRRLLDNALKFTPRGGQVTVTAEPLSEWAFSSGPGPGLRVVVADTGVGLRREDCGRIFEPFVQLETSYLQHTEGVGLGLTLARRQVDLCGGRLWVDSDGPGQGSTFTLVVPAPTATPGAAKPA